MALACRLDERADRPPQGDLSGADEPFGFAAAAADHGDDRSVPSGTVIGDVVIVKPLAEGGMGSVYEARELETGRPVAVKFIRDRATGPEARERFVREARLLARLRHPNVAQIHAFGTHLRDADAMPYLVLELVEHARSITGFAHDARLGVRERVRLLRDACLGIAHAHERGVVHRDIKPGNLLVDGTGSARVIDFGVARSLAADAASFATATGEIVGTLQYMSPEQLLGDPAAIDARSDVYSIGLVLHELVVGRPPYDLRDASYPEAARIVGGGAAPSTTAVARVAGPECGRDDARALAVVVATCLEKAPADRYASAAAVVADLDRWLEGRPITARPPTAWESVRRFARRHRAVAVAGCVTSVVLVAALGAISWLSVSEHRQRRDADSARRIAETARGEAEEQAAMARDRLYLATVLLAAEARDGDNVAEATRLLETARGLLPQSHAGADGGEPIELACLASSLDESSGVVARHADGVTAVAVAPVAQLAAVAGRDGTLLLPRLGSGVDPTSSGRVVASGHEGRIWRLAFAPDGRRLASAGADGRVIVRDMPAGDVVTVLEPHDGPVYGAAFSPDGTRLATAGRDGMARLWDTATWQEQSVCRGHAGTVYAVAFAADGSGLATAGADHTARIWDASTGREVSVLSAHTARVFDVAFGGDGSVLATAGEDGTARLWDRHTAACVRILRHPSRVNAVAFVADEDLATASGDGVLRLWRTTTGDVSRLRGHTDAIWTVARQEDGRVVTGSDDGTARCWRMDGGDAPVLDVAARVHATAYAPDGRLLAAGLADGAVVMCDAESLRPRARLSGGVGRVNGLGFSPDGAWLAGACDEGSVVIWSVADAAVHATWKPHTRRVYAVSFAADGRRVVTASEDGTARLWDCDTGAPLGPPLRHGRRVFAAALSPDQTLVATASEDRSVRLWDVRSGEELRRLLGHDGPVNWVAFSPDGRRLASASSDGTVRLWAPIDGTCTAVLTGPARQVWKAVFAPDGSRVAGVCADGTTTIWDARSAHAALVLRGAEPATRDADTGAMSAVHDAPTTGRPRHRRGHADQVWGLAFSPDGRRLATGSWDGTVRIWGVSTADAAAARAAEARSWNQFRGPDGDGRTEARLPLEWNEHHHVRWKTAVPGKAWGSPVEADGRIWLTNATEDGKRLSAVGLDAATGRLLHDITLFEPAEPMYCHPYNSYGSPTPVVADGRVFVHFGSAGTACLDAASGEVLWKRDDLPCDHHRGPGSSPIPVDDLLVINFDGFDVQYVVALEQATGKTVWKTDRTIDYGSDNGDLKKAYCTPTVIEHGGRRQLVSPGAVGTVAYDPTTGRELWKVHHGGFNAAARPLFAGGVIVIAIEGGDRVVAVRPDGEGDVTRTHVAWKFGKSTPTRPSPCVVGDHLYMVSDRGIFTCLDLRTGEARWQERREGRHSAALVESQGRLYACDEDGTTVVIAADPTGFRVLAENRLDDGCMASPCVVGDDLVLRTKTHLYRIGE